MKDKTIAISIYLSLALLVAGLLIVSAVSYFGDMQDDLIQYQKKTENY